MAVAIAESGGWDGLSAGVRMVDEAGEPAIDVIYGKTQRIPAKKERMRIKRRSKEAGEDGELAVAK